MHDEDSRAAMAIQMAGVITQLYGALFESYHTVKFARKLGGRFRVSPFHYRRNHSRRYVQKIGEQTYINLWYDKVQNVRNLDRIALCMTSYERHVCIPLWRFRCSTKCGNSLKGSV